ncbi:hypothetical protein FDO65_18140 [Nakamurella flava]|uniref:Integral membrane bound transporter domain-containing protein n=1 Tax=Nakamurella flava TaxID=2576308 RepID=A0A4U6QA19_9ACTN|nr:FUSC family protein [Nakamurella flava]TKV56774.1 hypothetical protein FDO65_18140 [Nakamurella flava]
MSIRPDPAPSGSRPYQVRPRSWSAVASDIGRTLVAALIAWELCRRLGSPPSPIYAVIVPVLTMRTDPFASFDVSLTRIVGVLLGVTLGLAALHVLPPTLLTLGLLLLVGLGLGSIRWGSRGPGATVNAQVALSALLVFAAADADPHTYAWDRLWETVVGAVVTVVVALLLVPPNPVRAATGELAALAAGMAEVVTRVTTTDAGGSGRLVADAADLSIRAEQLADDVRRAGRTGRVAPTHLRHRAAVRMLLPRADLARSVGHQLTALATTVDDLAGREVYDRRWPVVREQAGAVTEPLGAAIAAALTGADCRAEAERAGAALLTFRQAQPDPVAVLLRNPMRRVLDRLAAFAGLPLLDMRSMEEIIDPVSRRLPFDGSR